MKKKISIKQYVLEKNDRNEILISFYQVTKRDYVAGCTEKSFHFDNDKLLVDLKVRDKYVLTLEFKDLGDRAPSLIDTQKAIMILEINKNDDDLPYHYVALNKKETESA